MDTGLRPSSNEGTIRLRSFNLGLMLALLAILASDITVRALESRLSGNVANISDYPQLVTQLGEFPGEKIAVVGNSLIGEGFDPGVFLGEWAPADRNAGPAHAIKLVPDGSGIWDWHCVIDYHLARGRQLPDLVIIGFGWNQLADQSPLRLFGSFNQLCPARAMADFSGWSDRVTANTWLEMIAVKTSKIFAQRDNLRHGILQHVIPNYRQMAQGLNVRARQAGESDVGGQRLSYSALAHLIGRLETAGSRVILVAMPVMSPYPLHEGLCSVLEGHVAALLDMRHSVDPSFEYYRDNLHLNERGAMRFSAALATELRSPPQIATLCSS
jgi:hypothetical protein